MILSSMRRKRGESNTHTAILVVNTRSSFCIMCNSTWLIIPPPYSPFSQCRGLKTTRPKLSQQSTRACATVSSICVQLLLSCEEIGDVASGCQALVYKTTCSLRYLKTFGISTSGLSVCTSRKKKTQRYNYIDCAALVIISLHDRHPDIHQWA